MATSKKKAKKSKKIDKAKKATKVTKATKKVAKKTSGKAKKATSRKGMVGTHPPHPKCPKCEKAMYKTMIKGKAVAKEDPFAFCRNPDCELYSVDQDGNASEENKLGSEGKDKSSKTQQPSKKGEGKESKRTLPKKVPVKKVSKKSEPESKKSKMPKTDKIKTALLKGKLTQAEIAEKFDCSRKKVRAVRNALQDEGLL